MRPPFVLIRGSSGLQRQCKSQATALLKLCANDALQKRHTASLLQLAWTTLSTVA